MMLHVPDVLSPTQVREMRAALDATNWIDGRETVGEQGAQVKRNRQLLESSPVGRELGSTVLAALARHALFFSAALPSRVIKTYVRLGLGVGIVAEMAVRDESNADLVVRPMGHVFGQNIARVAFKRSAYLRNFVFKFAELLSDRLDRNLIAKALSGHQQDYEL